MKTSTEIAARRKALCITQAELARMVTEESGKKMTQQALAKFESNPNARTWHLPALVAILDRIGGKNPSHIIDKTDISSVTVNKVPLISWETAGKVCQSRRPLDKNDVEAWMLCPSEHSNEAYYLRVVGNAMAHEYTEGDLILIDPLVEAIHGDDVAIMLPTEAVVLKRLHITPDGRHLESINQAWPNRITHWADGSVICGVVMGMIRPKARKR